MNDNLQTGTSTGVAGGKAAALAAAAAMAGGMQTYADPVRFDNVGGQFVWGNQHLDVTRPNSQQPNTPGDSTSFQSVDVTTYPNYPGMTLVSAWADGTAVLAQREESLFPGPYWVPDTVSMGHAVNGSMDFSGTHRRTIAMWWFEPNHSWYSYTLVPRNGVFYLPLRFKDGSDAHYGWIAGEWRGEDGIHALAWGYETTPNTAIAAGAVPAPGTLAALAFGAAALGRRPRREHPNSTGQCQR